VTFTSSTTSRRGGISSAEGCGQITGLTGFQPRKAAPGKVLAHSRIRFRDHPEAKRGGLQDNVQRITTQDPDSVGSHENASGYVAGPFVAQPYSAVPENPIKWFTRTNEPVIVHSF